MPVRISGRCGLLRSGVLFFFFSSRRRHTRLVSDWSSDVCSSDLRKRALSRLSLFFSLPPPREKGRDEKGLFSFLWSADDEYIVAISLALLRAGCPLLFFRFPRRKVLVSNNSNAPQLCLASCIHLSQLALL